MDIHYILSSFLKINYEQLVPCDFFFKFLLMIPELKLICILFISQSLCVTVGSRWKDCLKLMVIEIYIFTSHTDRVFFGETGLLELKHNINFVFKLNFSIQLA